MDTDERISKLNEAAVLLNKASELVKEASDGMDISRIASIINDLIDNIISSNDASILTIRKDLEYRDEEHPIWTRPLVSVKNVNRRDI